jgi:DNA-binding NarL/FixJ family response regulator
MASGGTFFTVRNRQKKMTKILVVDDHAVVRSGIREFLAAKEGLEVVGEAATGAEALSIVRNQFLNVVLLDVSLPDVDGLELLKRIKFERPDVAVLMFSMYPEDDFAVHAIDAGASGYLNKGGPPGEILNAINAAANGSRYVSPALAERLLTGAVSPVKRSPHEKLSRREMEVLLHLSNGISLTKIGELLHLSVKTIGTYRGRILEKLNVRSNAELTRYVLLHKLG